MQWVTLNGLQELQNPSSSRSQCRGTIVSSPFSGMAARNRLFTFFSGLNQVPFAILACVMIMMAINTSWRWGSL